jgi:N-acetylglucosaminyldiphosphoundecaprenol N-acetyl-beta-D-mannosaminyltransferase
LMPEPAAPSKNHFKRILGVDFLDGSARDSVDRIMLGGLLVVPAAPALKDISTNRGYRDALLNADLCITDSGFMVLVWILLTFQWLSRLSGLQYLRCLLREPSMKASGNTIWIMASESSASRNIDWLKHQGIDITHECIYIAPMYGRDMEDPVLMEFIESKKPQHIIVTIGGGTQERLGLHLKKTLSYRPAIHCIGAAIAFLSGDQVHIPVWADTLFMGWLFRAVSDPGRYVPRYWDARKLFGLMARYRDKLPPLVDRRLS